jgi:hypothetical protein
MTLYVGNVTTSNNGDPDVILSAFETSLELQDSTNNPIKLIDILEQPTGYYCGVLVTTGTIV